MRALSSPLHAPLPNADGPGCRSSTPNSGAAAGRQVVRAARLAHLASLRTWLLATSVLVLSACGGGGTDATSTGTTSSSADTGSSDSSTTYTAGTVSGFGSIIVNGVRFDDSAVTALDDDDQATAVLLGTQVEVQSDSVVSASSSDSSDLPTAKAHHVRVRAQMQGLVDAVDSSSSPNTFSALGQTVEVTEATVFGSTLPDGIASLTAGSTVVRVHGLSDSATGHLLATRVDAVTVDSTTIYLLRGQVSALDSSAQTFQINGATFDYSGASNPPSTLADGVSVRLILPTSGTLNSQGQWVVSQFGSLTRSGATTGSAVAAHIHGTITQMSDSTHFTVNGIAVDAGAVSSLPATLAVGVEVTVTGTLTNGTLVASAVTVKAEVRERGNPARYHLHGTISSLDTVAQTFVLRGVTVSYASVSTWLPSGASAASLVDGLRVQVKGSVGSNRSQLTASQIRIESSTSSTVSTVASAKAAVAAALARSLRRAHG